jgi:hypothetical protein
MLQLLINDVWQIVGEYSDPETFGVLMNYAPTVFQREKYLPVLVQHFQTLIVADELELENEVKQCKSNLDRLTDVFVPKYGDLRCGCEKLGYEFDCKQTCDFAVKVKAGIYLQERSQKILNSKFQWVQKVSQVYHHLQYFQLITCKRLDNQYEARVVVSLGNSKGTICYDYHDERLIFIKAGSRDELVLPNNKPYQFLSQIILNYNRCCNTEIK